MLLSTSSGRNAVHPQELGAATPHPTVPPSTPEPLSPEASPNPAFDPKLEVTPLDVVSLSKPTLPPLTSPAAHPSPRSLHNGKVLPHGSPGALSPLSPSSRSAKLVVASPLHQSNDVPHSPADKEPPLLEDRKVERMGSLDERSPSLGPGEGPAQASGRAGEGARHLRFGGEPSRRPEHGRNREAQTRMADTVDEAHGQAKAPSSAAGHKFRDAVKRMQRKTRAMKRSQTKSVMDLADRNTKLTLVVAKSTVAVKHNIVLSVVAVLGAITWKEINGRCREHLWGRVMAEALACMCSCSCAGQVYWLYTYYLLKVEDLQAQKLAPPSAMSPFMRLRNVGFLSAFLFEAFVSILHPFPFVHFRVDAHAKHIHDDIGPMYITEDILAVFAFLKVYTMPRMLVYLGLFQGTKIRFLGALNSVDFSLSFVIKSYMKIYPIRMLAVALLLTVIIAGYALEICEADSPKPEGELYLFHWMNYIWAITLGGSFTPAGTVPVTLPGELVVTISSFFGLIITSTLIAVIASSMSLNFSESKVVDNMRVDEKQRDLELKSVLMLQRTFRAFLVRKHGGLVAKGQQWLRDFFYKPYSTDVYEALRAVRSVKREFENTKETDLMCSLLDEVFLIKRQLIDMGQDMEKEANNRHRDLLTATSFMKPGTGNSFATPKPSLLKVASFNSEQRKSAEMSRDTPTKKGKASQQASQNGLQKQNGKQLPEAKLRGKSAEVAKQLLEKQVDVVMQTLITSADAAAQLFQAVDSDSATPQECMDPTWWRSQLAATVFNKLGERIGKE